MGLFEHFPYTNFHSLNIQWAIDKIKELLQQGETLYSQLQEWKTDTDTELTVWKNQTLADLTTWKEQLTSALEEWKQNVDVDFSSYEQQLSAMVDQAEQYKINAETAANNAADSAEEAAQAAAAGTAALKNEAQTFDTTAAYASGEYVLYNGTLYRFTKDREAGSWTSADAKEVVISEELNKLNDSLSDFRDAVGVLIPVQTTWSQGNIILSNGASGGPAGGTYTKRVRTALTQVPTNGFSASLPDNIQLQCFWYADNSIGSYIGYDALGDISNLSSPRGAYVRFVLAYTDANLEITPTDAAVGNVRIYTYAYTDPSLTMPGKAADAKAVGDRLNAIANNKIIVDINGGGDYTSLTRAIYENRDAARTVVVMPGIYNIAAEYVDLFGQDIVNSLSDSTDLSGFQYGIRLRYKNVIFEPGSHLVCDWSGHTIDGTHRFSVLSIAENVELHNMDLDCTGVFYAIHDDYGSISSPIYKIYKNCRVTGHSIYNDNIIGGGCRPFSKIIIDGCYFDNGGADTSVCVRYHNSNVAGSEPVLWVSDSYFAQRLSFRWYGSQTTKMRAYVNNCHANAIYKGAEGPATTDNVDIVKWNNDEVNPVT